HFLEFILAQHPVVDEHAGKPVAQGAMHQGCSHGGIDSSGESADGPALFSYRLFDLANGFLDEVLRRPVSTGPADVVDKVAQQIGPQAGVMYLGMKLHRPDSS